MIPVTFFLDIFIYALFDITRISTTDENYYIFVIIITLYLEIFRVA